MKEATINFIMENNSQKEEFIDNMREFFNRSAKAWQAYISYEFIDGIELSESQKKVVSLDNRQMIINGSAGSGKSIV